MSDIKTIVLKFGGSVLADEQSLTQAVHEIYRWKRDGWRVVAVVSAFAGKTNALIAAAAKSFDRALPASVAPVVAGGELESAALLGVLLDRAGIPASVISPMALGLLARGDALNAVPCELNTKLLERALDADGVVVVPGFIGVDDFGRTVLLGRGGSDLSALFIASKIRGARCRLVKDVHSFYDRNPNLPGPPVKRYVRSSWHDALSTDGKVIMHQAVKLAQDAGLHFELGCVNSADPSVIGGDRSELVIAKMEHRPLRVALLGLGSVGRGVFDHLRAQPKRFEVVSVVARDVERHVAAGVPRELFVDPKNSSYDVLIEAVGGIEPALTFVRGALEAGRHVVTANKALIAAHGDALRAVCKRTGATLRYSASVGGGLPVIETVRRIASRGVVSIEAVMNGTSNFVLDLVRSGKSLADAVAEAQRLGFAEADPSRDLDGRDAGDKVTVIAQELGVKIGEIRRVGITAESAAAALAGGTRVPRQVARLNVKTGEASVAVEGVDPSHPLALLREEQNGVIFTLADGSKVHLIGRGAGRWPTAESVMADVLEIARESEVRS